MEGAAGTIKQIASKPGWVSKTMKRKGKASLPVDRQVEIQQWSHTFLAPFKILFTPNAAANTARSYHMEEIDSSRPLEKVTDPALELEILRYYRAAVKRGFFPHDFELYTQPSGKVALLDFDKFGTLVGRTVTLPHGLTLPIEDAVKQPIFTEAFGERLAARMLRSKTRSRSRSK